MRYTRQYQNDEWLYTVYCADDKSHCLLVAVFPGVAWQDVAIKLSEEEVDLLRRSEEQFTEFVRTVTKGCDTSQIMKRRVDLQIQSRNEDELILLEQ